MKIQSNRDDHMKEMLKIIGACMLILISVLLGLYALNFSLQAADGTLNNVDFSYFEDTSGQMNVSEVNSLFSQGGFTENKTSNFYFGRSHSAFWIRIFAPDTATLKNYIAFYCPNIQNVRLYIPIKEGYKTYVSGWGNSSVRQDEGMTYPVFHLDQERSAGQAIYLRVQSEYSHIYTIGFYNEQELSRARVINYCLNSFLFGILLTTVLVNLIIYFALKSKICLFFALCIFLVSAHEGCTIGIYNVIFPIHSNIIMQFSIQIGLLYLISIIVFFRAFSEVETHHRGYDLCSKVLIAACLLGYPICFIDKVTANLYAHFLAVVPPLFIFYASLRLYTAGKIKHRLFLIGWNITTITYILVVLCAEGILHLQNNYITIHGTLIGIVVVSILFTVAAVNFTKTMQMEHMQMRQQILLTSEQIKQMETALMQTQIKPHFLYNTLTSIEQMCEIDSRKAQRAIADFADYLRNSIDFSTETRLIRFEKELSNVKHYLALEQMRFEERLHVIFDVQSGGFLVPPLVVQPIVENAVRHGVTKKPEGGTVTVSVRETEKAHVIVVMDSGVGFDPDSSTWNSGRHIGINNVRERLSHQCCGSLQIDSRIGTGTTVTIIIPKGESYEPDCG